MKTPASPALVLLVVACTPAAYGAPSQATKDRCTQYAQRAVAQYQLMTSHPQCKLNDDMRWQNNVDNHYNACVALPEFIAKSEETARDSHLQACGGLAAAAAASPAVAKSSAVAASPVVAGSSAVAVSTAAGTGGTDKAGSSTTVPSGAAAAAVASPKTGCQVNPPKALPASATPVGIGASVTNGTLSFQSYQQKGRVLTYKVVRPAYIVAQMRCSGRVENLYGPWITLAGSQGPEIFYVNLGNTVSGAPLSAVSATQLMQP
jgi:hypothetical protein